MSKEKQVLKEAGWQLRRLQAERDILLLKVRQYAHFCECFESMKCQLGSRAEGWADIMLDELRSCLNDSDERLKSMLGNICELEKLEK